MRTIRISNRFKRDLKRLAKRGKDKHKLAHIIDTLASDQPLPHNARPHALTGEWSSARDCHVESDWVLIYELTEDVLILHASGTHQDLFKGY